MPPPSREDLWNQGQDETVEVNQRALIDKILARYSGEHTIFRELLQNADDAGVSTVAIAYIRSSTPYIFSDQLLENKLAPRAVMSEAVEGKALPRHLLRVANVVGGGAEHVQVKFYTQARLDALEAEKGGSQAGPSRLPDAKRDNIARYVVMNDGMAFRPQDWQRLKKIAEGNPDEEKIGAFGVGFYSLWSVCDDPFVESGGKWMGFYWKDGKDQLLARSGSLPPTETTPEASTTGNPWTSFTMDLREPTILEGPLDLARFFVTSLTFMRTMKKIDMLVDDVRVLRISKEVNKKTRVIKKGMKTSSTNGMMSVTGVDATGMTITAEVMQWLAATGFVPPPMPTPAAIINEGSKRFASFFTSSLFNRSAPSPAPTPPPPPAPAEDPMSITKATREVHTYQAEIKVTVSPAFGRELERATKKPPPKTMPASLVYSRKEEDAVIENGLSGSKSLGDVFAGLCPPLDGEKSAKIFIGQATSQTTGIGGHFAARFIPTVERESIDLVDKHVSHWNKELLWVGGYLSRLIYELEMQEIQNLWSVDKSTHPKLASRALHALRFFTFKPSTPSSVVAQEMEAAFFHCVADNRQFPILCNMGIKAVEEVKLPDKELQKFLPDLPTITSEMMETASRSIGRLQERGLLRRVQFDNVITQLGKRPLVEKEMTDCLQWWQSVASVDGYTSAVQARLIDAAILLQDNGKVVPLSIIQTFVKPQSSSIPTDMPLPPHTLPYSVTKDLKGAQIYPIFGWTELSVLQYITFLVNPPMSNHAGANPETDLRTSPAFAEKVLAMLGRAWLSIAANQQTAIALELKDVACIPTKAGFKKPGESYFEKNLLFDDLPTIALPKTTAIKGGMEKMLLGIGVRKTVDLQLVFSRLIGGGTWSCQDLMKYLVSVKDTLTPEEMGKLKHTNAFPLEQPLNADGSKPDLVRQKPLQLYEPIDAMRILGLPVLDWGEGKWKPGSDEARMLFALGLKRFPPIDVLLGIAAGRAPMNQKALDYLLANLQTHYVNFDPKVFEGVAFLPATKPDGTQMLAKPGEVYTNWSCAILGFAIADQSIASPDIASKLRISTDPPMEALVSAFLTKLPKDTDQARKIFEYLASRVGAAGASSLDRLRTTAFIPVKSEKDVQLHRSSEVYFAKRENTNELYGSAFTFVDFGEKANTFLQYCGVKSEPSVKDIAWLLIREPERTLRQAGSREKYLQQLRLLAANWLNFDNATRSAMKSASFVLGAQHVPAKPRPAEKSWLGGKTSETPVEEYEVEWVLCKASDVTLVDNITLIQNFGKYVLAGPEEVLLETFYASLGARWISSMVKTEHITNHPSPNLTDQARSLHRHVLERLTIFLAEARRKQSDYSIEWLKQDGNFGVREVRDLKAKHTLRQGKQEYAHYETLYATTSRQSNKAIILIVSTTAEPDDWDIASSLCNVLLKGPKADDALLLNSILTTPLVALKKRGFNVDRLLNQQREQRLRSQAEASRENTTSNIANRRISMSEKNTQGSETPTPAGQVARRPESSSDGLSVMGEVAKRNPFMPNGLKGKLPSIGAMMDNMPGAFNSKRGSNSISNQANGMLGRQPSQQSTKQPSTMADVRSTVDTAINMSKPSNERDMVNESSSLKNTAESDGNWCDQSVETNLTLGVSRGSGRMKIYVPNDEPNTVAFLQENGKLAICERFENVVLLPLARLFGLGPDVISIFWDKEGPTIAFNRGGSLYCNARYYAAWHDRQVHRGETNEAFISWYMSLAHELAHNLESAHNSRHEFHFSSIAETYLVKLSGLIKQ